MNRGVIFLVLGSLALSHALPLLGSESHGVAEVHNVHTAEESSASASASIREERGAISKSSAEVGPNGKVKSSSIAAKTDDLPVPVPEDQHEGHGPLPPTPPPLPPAHEEHEGVLPPGHEGHVDQPHEEVPPPVVGGPGPGSVPVPVPKPSVGGKKNVQVASAKGEVAVAQTQNKASFDKSFQSAKAEGLKVAVASAEDGRVRREVDTPTPVPVIKNVQVGNAKAETALVDVLNKKNADLNMQKGVAEGGKLAVAKVVSARAVTETDGVKQRVQVAKAKGESAFSKASHKSSSDAGPSSNSQLAEAHGTKIAMSKVSNE